MRPSRRDVFANVIRRARWLHAGLVVVVAATLAPSPALAQTSATVGSTAVASAQPASASSIVTLQAINVTGVVPGPGLWKVTRGDHVLWILGVVPTLPAGIEWRSNQVAQTIAASQTVLEPPGVKLKVDTNWFGKLFLLPSIYRAQRNPDGKTLHDVLPPDVYARWYYARERYFGDDYSIERYRPLLAAGKLMKKALKANGLHGDGEVTDIVAKLAKQHGVKTAKPDTTLEIKEPRQAVKAFAAAGPDGITCLRVVLDAVEHELPNFRARANAWATGDIETLRTVPESAWRGTCQSAITGAGFAKSLGIDNLPRRIQETWLAAADGALAANMQTFAVLPMHDLLDPDGYLAALQARGYVITAPDAGLAEDPVSANSVAPAATSSLPAGAATVH
ncbi:MAG TPA: TraB/GumN family protein [Rhodanobacteraceae bacterium]|nr:TraB/GumN family protein [Rhodanobacteraceae bacterium]